MFRKMAIALVAASVFTAPVLAQNDTLSGGSSTKGSQVTTPPAGESTEKAETPEKAEKTAESTKKVKVGKTVARHHRVARHGRHGTKAAKFVKSRTTAVYAKHRDGRTAKYARSESSRMVVGKTTGRQTLSAEIVKSEKRHMGYGRTAPKRAYGRVSKPMRSKTMTKPGLD
jgi:hypothetical protein